MRVIKAAVVPPAKRYIPKKVSRYGAKMRDFKASDFDVAEVLLEEGENVRNVYQNLKRYEKKTGVIVMRRGDRIFLARGDAR